MDSDETNYAISRSSTSDHGYFFSFVSLFYCRVNPETALNDEISSSCLEKTLGFSFNE